MELINQPIEVKAIYDYSREIKPVRFWTKDEQGKSGFKVERIIRRDKEKFQEGYITTFTCEIIINEKRKLCDLRYNHKTEEWSLYRF